MSYVTGMVASTREELLMLLMTNCRFLEGEGDEAAVEPRRVRFVSDDRRPSARSHFCEYRYSDENGVEEINEIHRRKFMERLGKAWHSHVLLYLHGSGRPEDVLKETRGLQARCDRDEPGLVLVVPVIRPFSGDDLEGTMNADQAPVADGVTGFLRDVLNWRDEQPLSDRKRINVFAHSSGARMFRRALMQRFGTVCRRRRVWRRF